MTKSAGAYLDGEPLTKFEEIRWGLTEGVVPLQAQFTVIPEVLDRLLVSARKRAGTARPFTTLQLISQTGIGANKTTSLTFNNVYVTGYTQHTDPRLRYVTVADSRIFWSYSYFRGAFNVRTKAGDKFAIREINVAGLGDIPQFVEDAISFKTYSLFPPVRDRRGDVPVRTWKISEMLKKLIARLDEDMKHSTKADLNFNGNPLKAADPQLQEDVFLDSGTDASIRNVMDLIPYIGIYTDNNGVVKFFNKNLGGEEKLLDSITTFQEPAGVPLFVTNELVAPEAIEVQFDSEIEMRFDFTDAGDESQIVREKEGRFLENVIEVPDPVIDLVGGEEIDRALHGEYINFGTYLAAIKKVGEGEGVLITERFVREYMVNGLIRYNLEGAGALDFRADWSQRTDAIVSAYRRKFRINKNFQDRIINLKAQRVATIDYATGARSPSPVFTNYARRLSERGLLAHGSEEFIENIRGWKALVNEARPCPLALINIIQVENGIFDVNYMNDPLGQGETTYPSFVENAPTWGLGDPTKPHFDDEGSKNDKSLRTTLSETHDLTTILTCTPAPSAGTKLFSLRFTPKDTGRPEIFRRVPNPKGPVYRIKVSPNIQTARFAWDDNLADQFDEAFGIGKGPGGKFIEIEPNYEGMPFINKEHLLTLGRAVTAAFYTKFVNRFEGSALSEFEKLEPNGTIEEIVHSVDTQGNPSTELSFGKEIIGPDFVNFLDPGTRAFILQQVKGEQR